MNLLTGLFQRKLSGERVQKSLSRLDDVSHDEPGMSAGKGTPIVSCVQHEIKPVRSVLEYIRTMDSFVRQASEQGACLVVFPEYNFFDMLGFIPGYRFLNNILRRTALRKMKKPLSGGEKPENGSGKSKVEAGSGEPAGLGILFAAVSGPVERAAKQIMAALAARYGLYVYSGSFPVMEGGKLFNEGFLFGPDGSLLGGQKKLHLTREEAEMGFSVGDVLCVFDLPFGKAAFPICMDATYFETFRIASERGAELVAIPIANSEEYSRYRSLRGIWTRVQESYVYGLKASLNGWVAGTHFTGIAGVFAPVTMTPDGTGVLAAAPGPEGDALVTCRLDLPALRRARENSPYYGDSNPEFERDYVERTYGHLGISDQ